MDAYVKGVWVPALSHMHMDDPMLVTPSQNRRASHDRIANVIMIARSKIRGMIAKKADCIYGDRHVAKFQLQIGETLVDMLQLGSTAPSDEIKIVTFRFL